MTEQEIAAWKKKIDAMSQEDMARLWRFAPAGHPVFERGPVYNYFTAAFRGFTPEISRRIGW